MVTNFHVLGSVLKSLGRGAAEASGRSGPAIKVARVALLGSSLPPSTILFSHHITFSLQEGLNLPSSVFHILKSILSSAWVSVMCAAYL